MGWRRSIHVPNLQRFLDHFGVGRVETEGVVAPGVWRVKTGRGEFIAVAFETWPSGERDPEQAILSAAGLQLSLGQRLPTTNDLGQDGKPLDVVHQDGQYFRLYKGGR